MSKRKPCSTPVAVLSVVFKVVISRKSNAAALHHILSSVRHDAQASAFCSLVRGRCRSVDTIHRSLGGTWSECLCFRGGSRWRTHFLPKSTLATVRKGTLQGRCSVPGEEGSGYHDRPPGSADERKVRLSRVLADRAVGTRTEVDKIVRQGRVKVEGAVVRSPKIRVAPASIIEVDGEIREPLPLLVAYHKPKGIITSMSDDWDRPDLPRVLPKSLLLRHHPVGRLDGDTSGLLLMSSNGGLTHKMLSPRFSVEREYVATVEARAGKDEPGDALVALLRAGVDTADGVYEADVLGISGRDLRLVVREGKHRMVRRMLANAGYPVLELRRERFGRINLGDLAEGEFKPVEGSALEWALALLGNGDTHGDGGE